MLDIKFIQENKELIQENCKNRRVKVNIDEFLELNILRRENLQKIESLRAERNKKSKGKPNKEEIKRMREVGDIIKKLEEDQKTVNEKYMDLLYAIPNLSHSESPVGEEKDYKVLFKNGEPPRFSFLPKTHDELMSDLDLIDFERGAKVTGSKFYFLKNDAVRLNQALINYGLDILEKHSFILFETPDMVKNEILNGSGFNPRGEESQIYEIKNNDLSLIGTAEITMLGFHANEVVDLSKGPKKYAALSHCFRTEGGAYGKTNKGLYRVHQFTKLEMFIFCKPKESEVWHKELLSIEKEICNGLDLPYRVIDVPTGDLGGSAYRKYDIEAWMTMVENNEKNGGYGEITSTSNCTDYQSRHLNIKYKKDDGSTELLHTLNGTAIVSSRFPVALFENHQQKDGSIKIPKALKEYFGKNKISNKMKAYNLIILPGWCGNHKTWSDFVKLANYYFNTVRVIELPCFGACPCPETAWGVEEYAKYARIEIEKLHFENIVLLGHSFGGQVAVKFVSEYPEMIDKLILSGPAVFRPLFSFRRFCLGLLAKFGKKIFELPFVEKMAVFVKKLLYNKIIGSTDYTQSSGIKREIFKKIIRQDLRHLLPEIKISTLILWGKKDKDVPVKDGKRMLKMMPNSYLHIFEKGGHGLHTNNKEEMILTIQHFLHDE